MPNDHPFFSDVDSKYYFWLGNGLRGPFDDYNEAHFELTRLTEGRHGKEESSQESSET